MDGFWIFFGIFGLGSILLGIGFTRRETSSGLVLMWLGTILMMTIIGVRISQALN